MCQDPEFKTMSYIIDEKKPVSRIPHALVRSNAFILDLDSGPFFSRENSLDRSMKMKKSGGRCCSWMVAFQIIFLLTLISIAASLAFFVYTLGNVLTLPTAHAAAAAECTSPECLITSKLFSSTINYKIDPCDDFYEFACGNWNWTSRSYVDHTTLIKERLIDHLRDLTTAIDEHGEPSRTLRQMKMFYDSCVNYDPTPTDLEAVMDYVNDLIRPNESLGTTLGRIRRSTSQSYIVKLYIGPDLMNTTGRRIFVDKPELSLPKQILLGPTALQEYSNVLLRGIGQYLPFIVQDEGSSHKLSLHDTVLRILEFETELAEAMTNDEDKTKPAMYNLVTLGQLTEMFNKRQELENPMLDGVENAAKMKFNWTQYLQATFENITAIDDNTVVDVIDFQYMRGLAAVIAKTSHHRLQMYLRWQILHAFGNKVLQRQSKPHFHAKPAHPRATELECIQLTGTLFPYALTHTYIRNRTLSPVIHQAKKILKDVVLSFQDMVIQSNWMEPETKFKAIKKAGSVKHFLGYPRWVPNATLLDEYHQDIVLSDSFFRNLVNTLSWSADKNLKSLKDKVDHHWSAIGDSPADVDAYYDDELNGITIPSGFLQPPFVGMGLRSIDYGALGYFIGHELIHGFDTEGRYSDENGRLSSWWTAQTLENFDMRTHCIEDQYNRFRIPDINRRINGKQTLKENIADISGLEQAFRAYHLDLAREGDENLKLPGFSHLTSQQLFFLSFAQSWCSYVSPTTLRDMVESNEHAPPKFRVLGSLSNSKSFSLVWNCAAGSRMNPKKKCVLW